VSAVDGWALVLTKVSVTAMFLIPLPRLWVSDAISRELTEPNCTWIPRHGNSIPNTRKEKESKHVEAKNPVLYTATSTVTHPLRQIPRESSKEQKHTHLRERESELLEEGKRQNAMWQAVVVVED
jgi:hypothetical protein